VTVSDVQATIQAAAVCGGAVLGRPISDTLKRVEGGRILDTVDRRSLFRAETPQVFAAVVLRQAFLAAARDNFQGTDEASLVERLPNAPIAVVEAAHPNPKLTTPADLVRIEALILENLNAATVPEDKG